jgi:hypothetical protein
VVLQKNFINLYEGKRKGEKREKLRNERIQSQVSAVERAKATKTERCAARPTLEYHLLEENLVFRAVQ